MLNFLKGCDLLEKANQLYKFQKGGNLLKITFKGGCVFITK